MFQHWLVRRLLLAGELGVQDLVGKLKEEIGQLRHHGLQQEADWKVKEDTLRARENAVKAREDAVRAKEESLQVRCSAGAFHSHASHMH